jgi:uncharacterized protein YbjT (DUF2867 family)
MIQHKTIAIIGATGAQGGNLARAILDRPHSGLAVRAITRHAQSDKARSLAERGAEVVEADLDDEASLHRAFAGAYGAYCVTNFWEHFSAEKEQAQAANLARAAQATGLRHVIWSTLEDTRKWIALDDERMPTLQGCNKVPHLDAKGASDHVFTDLGVPTTFLLTSFYWDNLIHFGMGPRRGQDGVLAVTFPLGDARLPGIAADDIGRCAFGLFERGDAFIGRSVGVAGEHLTGAEMAAALSRALGEEVRYNAVPPEVYRSFAFPGADDLGNMFQFNRDFHEDYCAARDLAVARSLNPALQTFESWLARNKGCIPIN